MTGVARRNGHARRVGDRLRVTSRTSPLNTVLQDRPDQSPRQPIRSGFPAALKGLEAEGSTNPSLGEHVGRRPRSSRHDKVPRAQTAAVVGAPERPGSRKPTPGGGKDAAAVVMDPRSNSVTTGRRQRPVGTGPPCEQRGATIRRTILWRPRCTCVGAAATLWAAMAYMQYPAVRVRADRMQRAYYKFHGRRRPRANSAGI
jgi:hypothetical protein